MTKLADFFTSIGFKVDDASFKKVQSQLESLKTLAQGINGKFSVSGGRAQTLNLPKEQLQAIREDVKRQKAVAKEVREQRQVTKAVKEQRDYNAHIAAYQKHTTKEKSKQERAELSAIRNKEREEKAAIRRTLDFQRKQELIRIRHTNQQQLLQQRHAFQMEKLSARGQDARTGMFTGGIAGFTARQLGAATAGFGAFEVGRGVFDIGTTMTGLRSAFTMMTGSAEGAETQIAFINKEVDRLSLNFQSAAQDYKQLLASAQSRIGIETTQELFSGLSEVGLVLGLTVDQQQRAVRAFSQMASKNRIMS